MPTIARVDGDRQAVGHGLPLVPCVAAVTVALAAVMVLAVGVGSVRVPLADMWEIITSHLGGRGAAGDPVLDQILWQYRVPRVLLAALCGAGLSVAGVVLQALVANPLADPYVLGVSSGASLGAVLVLTLGSQAAGGLGVSAAAFAGAMIAVALVFSLGQQRGSLSPTRLVLSGVAVGYVFISATSYVQLQATPNELRSVMFWLLGSVAGAEWAQLPAVSAVIVASTGLLVLFGRRLNALVAPIGNPVVFGRPCIPARYVAPRLHMTYGYARSARLASRAQCRPRYRTLFPKGTT